jgi:hypothetical protein
MVGWPSYFHGPTGLAVSFGCLVDEENNESGDGSAASGMATLRGRS